MIPTPPGGERSATSGRSAAPGAGKSWWLYVAIGVPWLSALVAFDPYLVSLVSRPGGAGWAVAGVIFASLTNLFWLYGFYHLANSLAGWWLMRTARPSPRPTVPPPGRVAILYATMNDLQERAVEHLLHQDQPGVTVFILDDSTTPEARARVDRVALAHPEVVVVRRRDRRGFKAGNLNHALRGAAAGFEYFAVVDADDCVPRDFVSGLISRFAEADDIAFVQARYTQDLTQDQRFAVDMGAGIDVHWKYYVPCRDRFGFLLFYGHGALIRRDVWERCGGFPEVVSEDLAFAARVRAMGFRGVYEPSVVCTEQYPPTYAQFLRRQRKWLRGTLDWLLTDLPRLVRDPALPALERLDVAVTSVSVLLPLPFLLFSAMMTVLAILAGEWRYLTVEPAVLGSPWVLGPFALAPSPPAPPPGLAVVTALTIFAPITGFLLNHYRSPRRLLRAVARGSAVHLSAIVSLAAGALDYLVTRRTDFRPTGDRSAGEAPPGWIDGSTLVGIAICGGAVVTFNPFPLALGIALVLRLPMEHLPASSATRGLMWVPFLLVALGTLLSAAPASATGSLLFLTGAHF